MGRDEDAFCRRCGADGVPRGTVVRRLAHEPFGWRPTTLLIRVRRYRCEGCERVWRQETEAAAQPRAKLSRAAVRWALDGLVVQAPDCGAGRRGSRSVVAHRERRGPRRGPPGPDRRPRPADLTGVTTIGVGEHVWCHIRAGDKYVTVVIDLTPVRAGTRPARLLDMVQGPDNVPSRPGSRHPRRGGATGCRSSRWKFTL